MKPDNGQDKIYNYPDIFSEFFFNDTCGCKPSCPDRVLILVYSGELLVRTNQQAGSVRVGQGGYIFLCRDENIILEKKSFDGQPFRSTFIGFSWSFLGEFYLNLNKKKIPENKERFKKSMIEITRNPYMESLYISLQTYFQWDIEPIKNVLEIKLTEAVYCLLRTDKRFFSCLFDTVQKNNKNIRCTPSSSLHPRCTTTIKCLETAYLKLQDGENTTGIYMEVGYKNIRNIMQIYDNRYGLSLLN